MMDVLLINLMLKMPATIVLISQWNLLIKVWSPWVQLFELNMPHRVYECKQFQQVRSNRLPFSRNERN